MAQTLPRVVEARPLADYRIELKFSDGVRGEVDLKDWIVGQGGVFKAIEDRDFFNQLRVNTELGTIEWPNHVDFCPDALYERVRESNQCHTS